MPYNTKSLKYDLATKPIPQHFNERIDDYEPLLGDHGASRVLLYDANGQPINPSNRLPADVTGSVGITGAVASNIQLIKDGQGRLYGYDGTTWRAVKVTTSGQLELAQNVVIDNVTVNVGAEVKVNNLETEPVPVTLSGKLAPLVRSYAGVNHMVANANYHYGNTSGDTISNIVPLDGTICREKAILFRNNYNVEIMLYLHTFASAKAGSNLYHLALSSVPAGASKWFTARDYPQLTAPVPGWGVYLYTGASQKTGTHDLHMFGGV